MTIDDAGTLIDPANQGIFANLLNTIPIPDGLEGRLLATTKSLYKVNGVDVYVGRDSNGFPHLLLPSAPGGTMELNNLSALITAGPRKLQQAGGREEEFVDLECKSGEADALFSAIAYEICSSLDGKTGFDGTALISAITQTIMHWRAILDAIGDAQSSSVKTGLLGELLTLTRFAQTNPEEAFKAWTGPAKTRHDFEFMTEAFEVKTSTSMNSKNCVIHGLNQLESAQGTKLYLIHFQVELAAEGLSVSALLNQLENLGISRTRMQQKISDVWKDASAVPAWFDILKFKVAGCSKFEVNKNFPKITQSNIGADFAAHVSDVQYRINLESVKPLSSTAELIPWQDVVARD